VRIKFCAAKSGCAILFELDERLCRNSEPPVQTPDHFERQRTPAVEYLVLKAKYGAQLWKTGRSICIRAAWSELKQIEPVGHFRIAYP
jgi:hypothetical protein